MNTQVVGDVINLGLDFTVGMMKILGKTSITEKDIEELRESFKKDPSEYFPNYQEKK